MKLGEIITASSKAGSLYGQVWNNTVEVIFLQKNGFHLEKIKIFWIEKIRVLSGASETLFQKD